MSNIPTQRIEYSFISDEDYSSVLQPLLLQGKTESEAIAYIFELGCRVIKALQDNESQYSFFETIIEETTTTTTTTKANRQRSIK